MGFSDLLDRVGGLGRFQFINTALLTIPGFIMASHTIMQNFSAAVPDHHCRIPNNTIPAGNWNIPTSMLDDQTLLKAFVPHDEKNKPLRCLQFTEPQWHLLFLNQSQANTSGLQTEPCRHGWTYNRQEFVETIVTEWDLVCDLRYMKQMSQTVYMGGVLAGALILSSLSDKFGRRRLLTFSYLKLAVSGTCTAFSPSYGVFCFLRFMTGMAISGVVLNVVCLVLEWTPMKSRTIIGTTASFSFTIGQLVLAGIAYGIRDWRKLQLVISVPFFICFFYSWWILESARWLIIHKKSDEALNQIKKVARINGHEKEGEAITAEVLKEHMQDEVQSDKKIYTVIDLFRTPYIRRTTLCLMILWCATSFGFYGLLMDLQRFGVSVFLVQVIFGAIDFPAKALCGFSMMFIGRRISQAAFLLISGLLILANAFVPYELQALRTTFAVLGKGLLGASFTCVYLYTLELYPTVIRQTGMGFGSTMARVGSMTAPIVMMLEDYLYGLPLMVYGALPVIAGLIVFFLPETRNMPLPDTIEYVEAQRSQEKRKQNTKGEITPEVLLSSKL
ncbi:solute carrier family 22 member 6-A-like isoform X1 [Erpetoichthys calabaricus]|uniref:solute carrier family 22 member 6-A-like isoform X1 n=1 Tax=Erpetoichthys calabaricus TaxID=27687 RepID=UPI002234DEC7|nr:solute carrier family 22 member 6-A-like isoform X1 [Erpetoichthys calabaricus]